jgi:hypothetical protein
MVYGIYNYSYWGESKPTYILEASHCTFTFTNFNSTKVWLSEVWSQKFPQFQ